MQPDNPILIQKGTHKGKQAYFKAQVETVLGAMWAVTSVSGGSLLVYPEHCVPAQ